MLYNLQITILFCIFPFYKFYDLFKCVNYLYNILLLVALSFK